LDGFDLQTVIEIDRDKKASIFPDVDRISIELMFYPVKDDLWVKDFESFLMRELAGQGSVLEGICAGNSNT
jgi:hypothetical protein